MFLKKFDGLEPSSSLFIRYFDCSLIAFDERVTFWLNAHVNCLVRVQMLLYLRLGSHITITRAHTQAVQKTHTHKAVAGRVEVKMVLSRRRQSDYK